MMISTLIIDDEKRARESLRNLLERYCPAVKIVGEAKGVKDGVDAINRLQPELVFLDIQMDDGTGFDLLEQADQTDFRLIFTTAFDDYAIKAFRFNAIDYLLKPLDVEELIRSVEQVRQSIEQAGVSGMSSEQLRHLLQFNERAPTITVSTDEVLEFVEVSRILRLESSGAYTNFVLTDGAKLLTSKNLKQYEALLLPHAFYRVHHSHLINMRELARYVKTEGGYLVMKNGDQVPLSRRRKEAFLHALSAVN